jgi:myosin protein heavy chain
VELENLFIAGDANQDGVLTLNEFREIVSSADASVSETNALRMFRETVTLMPDGGDSISPTAFAIVAHAHGLKAPATVVFGLLKKTWLQVHIYICIITGSNNILHAPQEV